MSVPQWIVVGIGVVLLGIVCLVRSFGQWTDQLIKTHRSQLLLIHELKVFTDRQIRIPNATNHVAPFCYEEPPPTDEERTA